MSTSTGEGSKGWYEQLKQSLDAGQEFDQFMRGFAACVSNEERIRKVYMLPEVHKIVNIVSQKPSKDAEESISLRDQGNKMFQKRSNMKAFDFYNKSVLSAPTSGDTSVLALALANRSAALLHMKQYHLCLLDIAAAVKQGYPENMRYKLEERRGKCCYLLRHKEDGKKAFEDAKKAVKLSGLEQEKVNNLINEYDKQIWQCEKLDNGAEVPPPAHSVFHESLPKISKANLSVPSMSSALSVTYTPGRGRGIVAEQDLAVGDLLVVEKPYSSTVLSNYKSSHCHHCCNRFIAPVACQNCSHVAYCSESCAKEAWSQYHMHECSILDTVQGAEISLGHLALKMVLKAGFNYLCDFKQTTPETDTEMLLAGFNEKEMYDSQDYRTVCSLVGHTESREPEDLLKYTLEAVFLLKCLETTDYFGTSIEERSAAAEHRYCVGGHLLKQLQMLPCNAHECSELAVKSGSLPESITLEIGAAIYPVLSLINHSCDPNVVRHSYGDVCVLRAIRNIKKGDEILDNYGALCALTVCEDRRQKLEPQYFFLCNCEACADDFPLYADTPTDIPVFKCDKCSGPVFLPLNRKYEAVECSSCKDHVNITPRVGILSNSDEKFRKAMMAVLTEESVNIDAQIPVLESHLQLMDRLLSRPWRDYNDCQEAVKQCYATKGSHFLVE